MNTLLAVIQQHQFGKQPQSPATLRDFLHLKHHGAFEYCTEVACSGKYEEAIRLLQYHSLENGMHAGWRHLNAITHNECIRIVVDERVLPSLFPPRLNQQATFLCAVSNRTLRISFPLGPASIRAISLFRFFCLQTLLDILSLVTPHGMCRVLAFNLYDQGAPHCVSMCAPEAATVLIPDYDFMASNAYEDVKAQVLSHWIPWDQRKSRVFWRGAASGYYAHMSAPEASDSETFTRAWLVRATKNNPYFDCGITTFDNVKHLIPDNVITELKGELTKETVKQVAFMDHRYSIDVDGWGSAFSGLFTKLLMGCTVFKLSSARNFRQWYYNQLLPYVHFVPSERSVDALNDQFLWCEANLDQARDIALRGRLLASEMTMAGEVLAAVKRIETFPLRRDNIWEDAT